MVESGIVCGTDSHLTGNADLDRQGFPATDNAVRARDDIHKKLLLVNTEIYIQNRIYIKKDSR